MNAQNAQSIGYSDGKERIATIIADGWTFITEEEFAQQARLMAVYIYRVGNQKTILKFVKGQREAYAWYKAEQEREAKAAVQRAAIPHNPSSRFCACVACSEQGE